MDGGKTDRKLWLEVSSNASVAWTIRLKKDLNDTSTGAYHNKLGRKDDRFALCIRAPCVGGQYFNEGTQKCEECGDTGDPSLITQQDCCLSAGYAWFGDGICANTECNSNSDCGSSGQLFCAFLNPVSDSNSGGGSCVRIADYQYDEPDVTVSGKVFRRGRITAPKAEMNWWTAKNWCLAQDFALARADDLNCPMSGTCKSAIFNTMRDLGWNSDKHWLSDQYVEGRVAYVIYLASGGGVLYGDKASMGTRLNNKTSRYAMCVRDAICPAGQYYNNGECVECPISVASVENVTDQSCCALYNGEWNNATNTCSCKSGTSWFEYGSKCLSNNACVYHFEEPESITDITHSYQSCDSNGSNCTTKSWREAANHIWSRIKGCDSGQYCNLGNNVARDSDGNSVNMHGELGSEPYDLYGECKSAGSCNPFTGVNGRQYCVGDEVQWHTAVTYCDGMGYKLVSVNDLCDAGTAPEERFTNGNDGCKNLIGVELLFSGWYPTVSFNNGGSWYHRCISPSFLGSTNVGQDWSNSRAICDMESCATGQWNPVTGKCGGCPDGYQYVEETGECIPDNICIYQYQWPSTPYVIVHNDNGISWTETKAVGYSEVVGCSKADEYCAIKWKKDSCDELEDVPYNGTLYGQCVSYNIDVRYYEFSCPWQ